MSTMARQAHWSTASRSPMAWPYVPLHELCAKRTGVRDPRLSPDTVFRYVDISSIDRLTKTVVDARAIAGRDAPSRARKVIKANDVVVSTTRPNLNAVAWIPRDLDGQIASTGLCVLRAAERLDPDYLFAYVRSPAFVASLSNLVVGALYPAVSDRQVMAQTIPLPPLPEQKRIAAALREQLDAAARLRAAAQCQADIAVGLWRRAADQHFLSEENARRERHPLREICVAGGQYGTSMKSNQRGEGIPVLGMPNIRVGRVTWDHVSHVDLGADDIEKYKLADGDLLFNRTNSAEWVGKTAVFRGGREAAFASYLVRFRVDPSHAIPEYVCALVNSSLGRRFIEANMARAIGQVNISASAMHRLPIPLPPVSEQAALVAVLDSITSRSDQICEASRIQASGAQHLESAFLRYAFSGGL